MSPCTFARCLVRCCVRVMVLLALGVVSGGGGVQAASERLAVLGWSVTPHVQSSVMKYRRPADPSLGALVRVVLSNPGSTPITLDSTTLIELNGSAPGALVESGQWSWHDFPGADPLPGLRLGPGERTVWTYNGARAAWGVDTTARLRVRASGASAPLLDEPLAMVPPTAWISAVAFPGGETESQGVKPRRMLVHVANQSLSRMRLVGCRIWVPSPAGDFRTFGEKREPAHTRFFPGDGTLMAGEKGGLVLEFDPLPLGYGLVEVRTQVDGGEHQSLWAKVRVRSERFDISGGWVDDVVEGRHTVTFEPFLKTLARLGVNTAHIGEVPGYTDDTGPGGLYSRYPLKLFHELRDWQKYQSDAWLPRVHAVEFLGEPQYGGGKPVPPMEVWRRLAPYQPSRLATTVTHSEERIWRQYAGLSDFPHYDAYRVTAPSPDAWRSYDRWDGEKLGWGAPLETIGEMCRSLRELNRPLPTAYWSQGPHSGWDSYGGRARTSPTPDELRLQAYHALASRITSLYWFNLSLKSLVKFPDTLPELERVGREIRLLERYYLEGDAYEHRAVPSSGRPDWELASIATPDALVAFALDVAYAPDLKERVFTFGPPRASVFSFRLPRQIRAVAEVVRVDADGVVEVPFEVQGTTLTLRDRVSRVAVYVVSAERGAGVGLERRRLQLVEEARRLGFDPGRVPADLEVLRRGLGSASTRTP